MLAASRPKARSAVAAHSKASWRSTQARHVKCSAELASGDKVKVTADLTVYHVPGFKSGIALKGKEGTVDANVKMFKETKLSPNYPWKVQFEADNNGKTRKFVVHLDKEEFEKA